MCVSSVKIYSHNKNKVKSEKSSPSKFFGCDLLVFVGKDTSVQ